MSDLGAISSYALAVNNAQMAMIKNTVQLQEQLIQMVSESTERLVAASATNGHNVDISI